MKRAGGLKPPAPSLDVVSLCLPLLSCSSLVDRLITRRGSRGLYGDVAAREVYVSAKPKVISREEEPVIDEPVIDESVIDEPVIDEPVTNRDKPLLIRNVAGVGHLLDRRAQVSVVAGVSDGGRRV